jgi:hypothetical protein
MSVSLASSFRGQLDLFPGPASPGGRINRQPLARNTDPGTSHAAADRMNRTRKRDTEKLLVLAYLGDYWAEHGHGPTSKELAVFGGLKRHVPGRRLSDLRNDGFAANWPKEDPLPPGVDPRVHARKYARECSIEGGKAIVWWKR